MASWEEHTAIQTGLNIALLPLISNPVILFVVGYVQHVILDNLIDERPINIARIEDTKEKVSLILTITGTVGFFILWRNNIAAYAALIGCLMPDILEFFRMIFSLDPVGYWMDGNNGQFHKKLDLKYIIPRQTYKADLFRRIIIVLFILFFYQMTI